MSHLPCSEFCKFRRYIPYTIRKAEAVPLYIFEAKHNLLRVEFAYKFAC